MCLIIRTKKDLPLSRELLAHMHKRNDDGFGFMWIQDNKLKTFKDSSSNFNLLWDKYNELKEFEPFIHLRYKTHGEIDWTNTHPYNCGHGIWLMHNGVIRVDDSEDRTKSDTWHFVDQLIKPLVDLVPNPHELIRSKKFKKIMEMQLGSSNRMVFGDRGGFVPFGEGNWHKINNEKTGCVGMWVSNTYAWDAHSFDPNPPPKQKMVMLPKEPWKSGGNYTNPQSVYYQGQSRLKDDKTIYWQGQEFFQIVNNIYETEEGDIYMNNGMTMKRRRDLDKQYDDMSTRIYDTATKSVPTESKQIQLPLVVSGGSKDSTSLGITTKPPTNDNIIDVDYNSVDDEEAELSIGFTQEDHDRQLTKEWQKRKPYEICTMVYTEADEAARVLNFLIAHGGVSV